MKKMKAFLDRELAILENKSVNHQDTVFSSRKKLTAFITSQLTARFTFWDRGLTETPRWVAKYIGESK